MGNSLLKDFEPRLYQETILSKAAQQNTLVVLPTGLGKTGIALMLAAHRLSLYPKSRVLVLAPTRPLVEQLSSVLSTHLTVEKDDVSVMTGLMKPEERQKLFNSSRVIVSTPQGLENDLIANRISLQDVSLLVFDEAHRAVGDYAYVWIAKQFQKNARFPLILGLTASPGSEMAKIKEVCENLHVDDVEVRTDADPDVAPYVQEVDVNFVSVELPPEFKKVKKYLEACYQAKLGEASQSGVNINVTSSSKKDILSAQAQLHGEIAQGNRSPEVLRGISLLAEAIKVQHALELIETQGVSSFLVYTDQLMSQSRTTKVRAVQNLVRDPDFKAAQVLGDSLREHGEEHPKFDKLIEIVTNELASNNDIKIIIFNQYRDNAKRIVAGLESIKGALPRLFVGQAKKRGTGMTQKEQKQVLDEFREHVFNIAVMTSVGEEGLDIPSVDQVIFYEPIPSAIRHIQRRGRTGRLERGKVTILMAKNTRDEAYRWSAFHKEKSMHKVLAKIKKEATHMLRKKQPTLADYSTKSPQEAVQKPRIIVDPREKGSLTIKELIELGAELSLVRLDVGDYLLSSRAAVEYKTVSDFVDSLLDGRIIEQVRQLKIHYERPLLLIQGTEDIYSVRNVHPNAIRGLLATITVSYGVPLIQSKSFKDAAAFLHMVAKREQEEVSRDFNPHGSLKPKTVKEQQEYVVSALPGVGATLSKPLLRHFKSVRGVVDASVDELKAVDLIGPKKAKAIRELLDEEYDG